MTERTIIRCSKLRKVFIMGKQKVVALDDLDLDIPENSFTVIMGPSGSGKSTLLYILGGLDRPTGGGIDVDGQKLETMDENTLAIYRRQKVGFIFQSFNLVTSMTALENVGFPLRFSGISGSNRRKIAEELLLKVGLEKRSRHRPTELSGGQQQRVAIARALVNKPTLILADEPTGNLDSGSGVSIMRMLSDLHKDGKTVLVVTHDPRMLHFATNAIYLLDGRVVSEAEYQSAITLMNVDQP
ncbi:MAG: ABC transporter ATP-binding protein [Anaerolineaceae bacterium]|nr:ABC transporter ATP-binding protein [Anaerolineaceae bacterium]